MPKRTPQQCFVDQVDGNVAGKPGLLSQLIHMTVVQWLMAMGSLPGK